MESTAIEMNKPTQSFNNIFKNISKPDTNNHSHKISLNKYYTPKFQNTTHGINLL